MEKKYLSDFIKEPMYAKLVNCAEKYTILREKETNKIWSLGNSISIEYLRNFQNGDCFELYFDEDANINTLRSRYIGRGLPEE